MTSESTNALDEIDRDPFKYLRIDDISVLNTVDDRSACYKCSKSRKYYCYSCFLPVESLIGKLPHVKLPIKIDIIKHRQEIDGKSTAAHAAILAPDDVKIYTYPDIPNYENSEHILLVYPSTNAVSIEELLDESIKREQEILEKGFNAGTLLKKTICLVGDEKKQIEFDQFPYSKVVIIDSTWNQSKGIAILDIVLFLFHLANFRLKTLRKKECSQKFDCLSIEIYKINTLFFVKQPTGIGYFSIEIHCVKGIYKDPRINSLKSIVLQKRASQFWRHQKNSPRWYLATIEAIHQFCVEIHVKAWGYNQEYIPAMKQIFFDFVLLEKQYRERDVGYCGQYDNLLFFFKYMHQKIHMYYDHSKLKAYKRPLR